MTKKQISNDKIRAEELILEAWDQEMLDKHGNAAAKALQAVTLDPDDWYINTSLGVFLREKGDLKKSLQFCKRAVELAPEMPLAWGTLAVTYLEQEKFNKAVESFAKSLELEERPNTYTMMASAKISLGDLEGAIKDSKRALELDPDWDEAEAMLKEAQELLDDR